MDIVQIGKILRPHGMNGAVVVRIFADNPRNLNPGVRVTLIPEDSDFSSLTIESVFPYKNSYRVEFRELKDRTSAERISKKLLGVPRHSLEKLSDNRYYVFDLVGCKVYTVEGEAKGHVDDVVNNPGNDLLNIIDNEKSYLIPMVKKFIKSIDLEKGTIIIDPIEGLLDSE